MEGSKLSVVFLLTLTTAAVSKTNHIVNQSIAGQDTQCNNDSTCPTWFTCNSQKHCQCESRDDGAVVCDERNLMSAVLICHCVTYDEETGSTFVGSCVYNCDFHAPRKVIKPAYHPLPIEPSMLINSSACTYFHRTGLLCGDCSAGYSPIVLSYNLSCVECPSGHKNWWKVMLATLLPLTCFYFFIIFFSINVTSSRLHGVVWFSQSISLPAFVRAMLFNLGYEREQLQFKVVKALIVFFSIWNLDFFRTVLPDICLNVSTLQALALEYLVALYPFLLILLSYFIIELYDRNCTCLITAWRPLEKVLSACRMSWDVRTSVIDSFATFFFLSYVKILSVSADLLMPTQIFQLGSDRIRLGLYYSPTVAYFGDHHLPCAILAMGILTVFVCIPTLIFLLYPCKLFQKFLSIFPFDWHFLHALVDSFQGCYKDGTETGTFDCRWFSVFMLLSRPLLFTIFGSTLSAMYFIYAVVFLIIMLIAIINIEPFKKVAVRHFSTDLAFISLLSLCYIALVGRQVSFMETDSVSHTVLAILTLMSAMVPIFYIIFLIGCWFFSRSRLTSNCRL